MLFQTGCCGEGGAVIHPKIHTSLEPKPPRPYVLFNSFVRSYPASSSDRCEALSPLGSCWKEMRVTEGEWDELSIACCWWSPRCILCPWGILHVPSRICWTRRHWFCPQGVWNLSFTSYSCFEEQQSVVYFDSISLELSFRFLQASQS